MQSQLITYLESSCITNASEIDIILNYLKESASEQIVSVLYESAESKIKSRQAVTRYLQKQKQKALLKESSLEPHTSVLYESEESSIKSQQAASVKRLQKLQQMNQGQALIRYATDDIIPEKSFALALFSVYRVNLNAIPSSAVSAVQSERLQSLGMNIYRLQMLCDPNDMMNDEDVDFYSRNFRDRIIRERLREKATALLAEYHSHSLINKSELFYLSASQLFIFFQVCIEEEQLYQSCIEGKEIVASDPRINDCASYVMQLVSGVLGAKKLAGIQFKSTSVPPISPLPPVLASVNGINTHKKLKTSHCGDCPSALFVTPPVTVPWSHSGNSRIEINKKMKTSHEPSAHLVAHCFDQPSAPLVTPSVIVPCPPPRNIEINKKLKTSHEPSRRFVTPPLDNNTMELRLKDLLPVTTSTLMKLFMDVQKIYENGPIRISHESVEQMLATKNGTYPSYIPKWSGRDPEPHVFISERSSSYYLRYLDIAEIDKRSPGRFSVWMCERSSACVQLKDRILSYGIQMSTEKEMHYATVDNFYVIGAESAEAQLMLGKYALALCIEWVVKYCYASGTSSIAKPFIGLKAEFFEEDGEIYRSFIKSLGFRRKKGGSYVFNCQTMK